jgi:hypothetical protein
MAAPTIRLPYRGSHCNGGAVFDKIFYLPFTGEGHTWSGRTIFIFVWFEKRNPKGAN